MKKKYFVHESSCVDKGAKIGEGTKIWYFCHICEGAVIGKNCNIGQNVFIDKGVRIGDNVKIQNNVSVYAGVEVEDGAFLGPSCVFTNVKNPRSLFPRERKDYFGTKVGKGASIGANATVVCGHNVGSHSFIGAGAVVTKDTAEFSLMVGNPARLAGWMCECGARIEFDGNSGKCPGCKKIYDKAGEKCIEKRK
ncbi:MAG: acyltransferase [Elusimicrobiota bacterium]